MSTPFHRVTGVCKPLVKLSFPLVLFLCLMYIFYKVLLIFLVNNISYDHILD